MASKLIIKTRKKIVLYTFIEIILIFISYSIVFYFQKEINSSHIYTFLFLIFWPIVSYISNRYENILFKEKLLSSIIKLILSSLIMIFIYSFFATIIDIFKIYKLEYKIAYSYIFLLEILSINFIFSVLLKFIYNKSSKNIDNVRRWFYIGSSENLNKINNSIAKSPYSKQIKIKKIQKKDFNKIISSKLIIDNKEKIDDEFFSLIDKNIENILRLYTIEDWYEEIFEKISIDFCTLENIYQIKQKSSRNDISNKIKRIGDISLSLFIIITLSPFILLFSILIWIEDRGPILYTQKRVGLNGKIFDIYKFRSMHINAEIDGVKWASRNDPRTTFIGNILRKTRFDEIPQLYSVLKGEMSLIGPRPERPEIEKTLKENIDHYNLKYLAKPGLSGWAQVKYPYGSSIEDSKNKLSFDIFYIKNKSILMDFIILVMTLRVIFNFHRYGSN